MAVVVSISTKQKTAVNKSGQVDRFKGKRMGPCAYKNFLRAQENKSKKVQKKEEEKPSKPRSVMENMMDLADRRAKGNLPSSKPRDIKKPYSPSKVEGMMNFTHVLPRETVKSIENNPRVLTGKTIKMVSDYHLRGLGIDPKAKRLSKTIEVDQ